MIFGMLTYLADQRPSGAARRPGEQLSAACPSAARTSTENFLLAVAVWGARVFETGLLIALPAVIALVIVNLALGVVTRAAPQLNLFGIGFTITLLCGILRAHRRARRHHGRHLEPHRQRACRPSPNLSARPPRERADGREAEHGRRTHRRAFATTPARGARARPGAALARADQLRDHDRRQRRAGGDRQLAGRAACRR